MLFVLDGREPDVDASVERALEAHFRDDTTELRIERRELPPSLGDQSPLMRGLSLERGAAGAFWLGTTDRGARALHFVAPGEGAVVTRAIAKDRPEPVAESIALIARWTVDALLHDEPVDAPLPAPEPAAEPEPAPEPAPSPDPEPKRRRGPTFLASEDPTWEPSSAEGSSGGRSAFDARWSPVRFEIHVSPGASGFTSALDDATDPGFQFSAPTSGFASPTASSAAPSTSPRCPPRMERRRSCGPWAVSSSYAPSTTSGSTWPSACAPSSCASARRRRGST